MKDKQKTERKGQAARSPQPPSEYPLESLLTVEEVAHHFRVSTRTVMRMIDGQQIRAVRVGRQWRFKKEWVEEWLAEQTKNLLEHQS